VNKVRRGPPAGERHETGGAGPQAVVTVAAPPRARHRDGSPQRPLARSAGNRGRPRHQNL